MPSFEMSIGIIITKIIHFIDKVFSLGLDEEEDNSFDSYVQ